jgi:hypothetical protein
MGAGRRRGHRRGRRNADRRWRQAKRRRARHVSRTCRSISSRRGVSWLYGPRTFPETWLADWPLRVNRSYLATEPKPDPRGARFLIACLMRVMRKLVSRVRSAHSNEEGTAGYDSERIYARIVEADLKLLPVYYLDLPSRPATFARERKTPQALPTAFDCSVNIAIEHLRYDDRLQGRGRPLPAISPAGLARNSQVSSSSHPSRDRNTRKLPLHLRKRAAIERSGVEPARRRAGTPSADRLLGTRRSSGGARCAHRGDPHASCRRLRRSLPATRVCGCRAATRETCRAVSGLDFGLRVPTRALLINLPHRAYSLLQRVTAAGGFSVRQR